jgi:hypothetical protein
MEEEELESIVQTMIDNEEPEENIKLAIEEYDRQGKPTPTTPDAVVEETIASDPIIPENGELKLEDTSSVLQKRKKARNKRGRITDDVEPVKIDKNIIGLKINNDKKIPGFFQSFKNTYNKIFKVDIPLTGAKDITLTLERLQKEKDNFEKIVKENPNQTEFEYDIKQPVMTGSEIAPLPGGPLSLSPAARLLASKKTFKKGSKETVEKFYKEEIAKQEEIFLKNYVKAKNYQESLDRFGQPEVFDEDGLTIADTKSILGTQFLQMGAAAISFGGTTYVQESSNVFFDLVSKKAAELEGISLEQFNSYAPNIQAELMLDVVKKGQAEEAFKKAEIVGLTNTMFDAVSNFVVIAKAAKFLPKSVFRSLIRGKLHKNLKNWFKSQAGGQISEIITENAQEINSSIAKGDDITLKNIAETTAQTIIGTAGTQTSIGGTTTAINEGILSLDGLINPKGIRAVANSMRSQIKATVLDKNQQNILLEEIDIAEDIVRNTGFKNLNNKTFKEAIEKTKIVNRERKKESELRSKKNLSVQEKIQLKAQEEKRQDAEIDLKKIVFKNQYINSKEKLATYINAQTKGVFKDANMYDFKTVKQLENWLESDEGKKVIKNNKINLKSDAALNNLLNKKATGYQKNNVAFFVDETVDLALKDDDFFASNVVHHEGLHFVLDQLPMEFKENLINEIKKELKNSNDKEFRTIAKQLEQRIKSYENLPNVSNEILIDENFTALSDIFQVQKLFEKARNIDQIKTLNNIADIIEKPFKKNIPRFDVSMDAFSAISFLKSYNNFKNKTPLQINIPTLPKTKETEEEAKASLRQIASEEVQKAYDEKGIEGAFEIIERFKPITTKIARKRREAPGYNEELLISEIELGKGGIIDLIRTYNVESGVPLAAYINKNLPLRAIAASRKILGEQFTQDVTEARGVVATETAEQIVNAEEAANEIVVSKKLSEKLNVPDDIIQKIKLAVQKTFGTKLPSVTNKKFKNELRKNFRIDLKKPINNMIGKKENYENFLRDNFEIIYEKIPLSTIKKRFNAFAQPVIDPRTGKQAREKTAEGNKIFEKKKITKNEFVNFFLGEDVGRSTQGTRKTTLAETIAEELALDYTYEVITDPKVMGRFKEIQTLQGFPLVENMIAKVALEIDRGSDISIVQEAKNQLISAGNFTGVALKLARVAKKHGTDSAQFNNIKALPFIKDFIIGLEERNILSGPAAIGIVYEQILFDTLSKVNIDGIQLLDTTTAAYDSTKPDLQLLVNGVKTSIEAKLNKRARLLSNSIRFDLTNRNIDIVANGKIVKKSKFANSELILSAIENLSGEIQSILNFINKNENENISTFPLGKTIQRETWNKVKKLPEYKKLTSTKNPIIVGTEQAAQHYNSKGNHYIQIGDLGFYYIGENIANFINVPPLEANIRLKFRIKFTGTKNDKNIGYLGIKVEGFFEDIVKPSPVNLNKVSAVNIALETLGGKNAIVRKFNNIVTDVTGIKGRISEGRLKNLANKKRFRLLPPSGEDFVGLLYYLAGKGEKGTKDLEFFNEAFVKPFAQAMFKLDGAKQAAIQQYNIIKKSIKQVKDEQGKRIKFNKVNKTGFTNEQAVRLYIWDSLGYSITETDGKKIPAKDLAAVKKYIENNKPLLDFVKNLKSITTFGYIKPDNNWTAGTLTTDLLNYVNKTARAKYLTQFIENVDAAFTQKNLNKLKTRFGESYVSALEDILYRMKTGRRRPFGKNKLTNELFNWVQDTVGTIMFLNSRSALLQQISFTNFINFDDNNPIAAGKALANTKQFSKDFAFLFNSDFLKQRRSGVKTDVASDEIAKAAEQGGNSVRAIISILLKKGFILTQIGDSIAISLGGASFYRNRINTYKKQGLEQKEAEEAAFLDFQEAAEETQQSARPDRVSQQQASPAGRIILNFGNVLMQYNRRAIKDIKDLVAKRPIKGKTLAQSNMQRIIRIGYYYALQSIVFNTLQSAMFASFLDEDEDEERTQKRVVRVADQVADGFLRGFGFGGAIVSTGKNIILESIEQYKSGRPNYENAALEIFSLSPPINSKLDKSISIGRTFTYRQSREKIFTEGLSFDNPAIEAAGKAASVAFNIPADRVIRKLDNLSTPLRQETDYWQSIALALGYSKYDVNLVEPPKPKKKSDLKSKKLKPKKL